MSSKCLTSLWSLPPKSIRTSPCKLSSQRASRLWRTYASESESNIPERSRKLPNAREPYRLRPGQRKFLIGILLLTTVGQAYLYYNKRGLQDSFVKYKLVGKETVSSTASIFKLAPAQESVDFNIYKEAWRKGIWNVHFKQPQIQIVRAYTPLPPKDVASGKENEHLRFLIRRDPHGEVSSYLHNLPVGAEIELRGPNLEYVLTPDIRQVVFFAGGTGIAPALQIAHTMFDAESVGNTDELRKGRKLHILWANRNRADCAGGRSDAPPAEPMPPKIDITGFFTKKKPKPESQITQEQGVLVRELEELKQKYPGCITVEYFVNQEDTWIDEDAVYKALSRFDDKDFSTGYTTPQEQRQILISGPSGFISYLAGPKEWRGGKEDQGGIGKILAHAISMNPHNVKVWKI